MTIKDKIMELDKSKFTISKFFEVRKSVYNSNNAFVGEILNEFICTINIYKKYKNIKIDSIEIGYINDCDYLDKVSLKGLVNNILNTDIKDKNINRFIY